MQDEPMNYTVTVTLTYEVEAVSIDHANDIVKEIVGDVPNDRLSSVDFFAIC